MAARPHKNISFTWDETYTLPENFYLAYQRGAGARYRQLAQRFLQDDTYFGPLALNKNVLPGQHAYSHVNALCSAMQAYLTDGSEKHLTAARNGFAFVQAQSYATGGWGPNEGFVKPDTDELAESLTNTHSTFETPCGAYGHFKITRYLMRVTGDSRYGDAWRPCSTTPSSAPVPSAPTASASTTPTTTTTPTKSTTNRSGPAAPAPFPSSPPTTASAPTSAAPTASTSTSTFLRASPGSREAHTPRSPSTHNTPPTATPACTSPSRIPSASPSPCASPHGPASKSKVTVNGNPVDATLTPGTWANLDRTWKDGDRIELSLDMPLRLAPIDDRHPQIVALLYGPVALFAIEPWPQTITQKQLLAAQRIGNSSAWEVATDSGKVRMLPYPDIKNETYRLYHQT